MGSIIGAQITPRSTLLTDQIQRNIIVEKVLSLPKEHEPGKGTSFREVKSDAELRNGE